MFLRSLPLIVFLFFRLLLNAQVGGVYVTDVELYNKSEQWCWAFEQDTDKNMLFGVGNGVVVFDGTTQHLVKLPFSPLAMKYDAKNNKVWVSGYEYTGVLEHVGYGKYNYKHLQVFQGNEFNEIKVLNDSVYFFSDTIISVVGAVNSDSLNTISTGERLIEQVIAYQQQIYMVIDYFLYRLEGGQLHELINADFPVDEFAFSLQVDSANMLLGTKNRKMYTFNGKYFRLKNIKSAPFFDNNVVTGALRYNDSTLLLQSLAGGIALIDINTNKVTKQISYFNGLPDDEIRAMFIDDEKGVWVSHEFGISRIDFTLGVGSFNFYPGLKGSPVALNYFEDKIHVATSNGLFVLDKVKNYNEFTVSVDVPVNVTVEVPVKKQPKQEKEQEKKKGLFSIFSKIKDEITNGEDAEEKVETRKKVIQKTKTRTVRKRSLKSISHYFKPIKGIEDKCRKLVQYDDYLLVAGNNGLYAVKNKNAQTLIDHTYIIDIYYSDCCPAVYCSTNNGIYKVFRQNNRWKTDHFSQTTSTSITSVVNEKGDIWVFTYENRVARVRMIDDKLEFINESKLPEATGQVFFSKNINDSVMIFTDRNQYHFDSNGQLNLINAFELGNTVLNNQTDYLWFYENNNWFVESSADSLISDEQINKLKLFGGIRFIQVSTDGSVWVITSSNKILRIEKTKKQDTQFDLRLVTIINNQDTLENSKKINLAHNENYLTVEVSAPFYLKQNGVTFRYKLDGLDTEWSSWDKMPYAEVKYIPPGDFTFKVEAKNAIGQKANIQGIALNVGKPFTQTAAFIIILILVFIGIAYVVFKIRLRKLEHDKQVLEQKVKERTKTIEEQKGKIEKQHDEITQSIRYAKRIQSAMLPHDEIIEAMLPEHFILFMPRDIVSGDFYFFKPMGDKIVFVAADCTGHGVPGGFMSMLGISFLSEITSQVKKPSAATILDHLREKIKLTLGQTDEDSTQKDGMDMAICLIDVDNKKLEYAGAFNPLYILRNNELSAVKADRQPVAVYFKEKEFTNHEVEVQKGDTFYMFSDGYPDQIGGPKQRKFMTKNFKKLILDVHQKPMQEQKETLHESLMQWKGDSMQVDDILVVGFKI